MHTHTHTAQVKNAKSRTLLLHGRLCPSLLLSQSSLALRNLLVQGVVVARGLLLPLLLLGLFGRGGLDLLSAVERLALLANVGLCGSLLNSLGLGLFIISDNVLLVQPEFIGQPDGQGSCLGALDVDALNVAPLGGHPLLNEGGGHGVNVGGDLLGGPVGESDAHGGVGGGCEADKGGAEGLFNLLGDVGGGASIDLALDGLLGLGPLAVDLGDLGGQDNRNGSLLRGLVESLAEDLGQAVDDAVVTKEDIVLRKQLTLSLILIEFGLELAEIDNSRNLLAQLGGELFRGDNVLVRALGVRDDEADSRLRRVD